MSKILAVFAGANGSGKSTIVKKIIASGNCPEYFICPDNYVNRNNKDEKAAYLTAMKTAEQERETALVNGVSFSFETVLSKKEKIDFIKRAKEKGYTVSVYYVLTADVEINAERIAKRVSEGGHGVPQNKLLPRYYRMLDLMPEVLALADMAVIYDNSGNTSQILMTYYGKIKRVSFEIDGKKVTGNANLINICNALPEWFEKELKDKIYNAFGKS
jgi:predicted ABC-type ATPase